MAGLESGPMIRKGWNSYLTVPGVTSLEIMSGATCSEKNLQEAHCGSPYSVTVTGALASPSTAPPWLRPASWALTCCAPLTFEGVPPPPSSSLPPDWLITIRATITAAAANPAMIRYWSRRLRASSSACWDSTAWRSARRRSRSCRLPAMPGLYLGGGELTSGVGERPRCRDGQRERHQDRAGDAPLADRVDHEQLQIGQVEAEAETDQRREEAAEAARVTREGGRGEQQRVAEDPDDGNVDAREIRILAVGDRLTAASARQALGRAAAAFGDG